MHPPGQTRMQKLRTNGSGECARVRSVCYIIPADGHLATCSLSSSAAVPGSCLAARPTAFLTAISPSDATSRTDRLCGGFTTFSAFSLQTLILARDGRWLLAGAIMPLSVVLCLIAVGIGHWLAILLSGSGVSASHK